MILIKGGPGILAEINDSVLAAFSVEDEELSSQIVYRRSGMGSDLNIEIRHRGTFISREIQSDSLR